MKIQFLKNLESPAQEIKIDGYTPLILAVLYGTAATVQKLSEIPGISLDAANSDLHSPLWIAATKGIYGDGKESC